MNKNRLLLLSGFKDGIPISLGYFAVSFTFGLMASKTGLTPWQSIVMSITNLTSAGQFAGLGMIKAGSPLGELAAAQFIINLRYSLMSCSLSQKFGKDVPFFHRFLVGYGITDEIFGVSVLTPNTLNPWYFYGLLLAAVPGWTIGTGAGALSGEMLPESLLSALSVALYGMFLAVIIPPAKNNRILACIIATSMIVRLFFSFIPVLCTLSSGMKLIVITVLLSGGAAFWFPVPQKEEKLHA